MGGRRQSSKKKRPASTRDRLRARLGKVSIEEEQNEQQLQERLRSMQKNPAKFLSKLDSQSLKQAVDMISQESASVSEPTAAQPDEELAPPDHPDDSECYEGVFQTQLEHMSSGTPAEGEVQILHWNTSKWIKRRFHDGKWEYSLVIQSSDELLK